MTKEISATTPYSEGINGDSCKMLAGTTRNSFMINADFSDVQAVPGISQWVGYAVKSLPIMDWRSFVEEGYTLSFRYRMSGNVSKIHVEFTNQNPAAKPHNIAFELSMIGRHSALICMTT